jgi:hypothetical protein
MRGRIDRANQARVGVKRKRPPTRWGAGVGDPGKTIPANFSPKACFHNILRGCPQIVHIIRCTLISLKKKQTMLGRTLGSKA